MIAVKVINARRATPAHAIAGCYLAGAWALSFCGLTWGCGWPFSAALPVSFFLTAAVAVLAISAALFITFLDALGTAEGKPERPEPTLDEGNAPGIN